MRRRSLLVACSVAVWGCTGSTGPVGGSGDVGGGVGTVGPGGQAGVTGAGVGAGGGASGHGGVTGAGGATASGGATGTGGAGGATGGGGGATGTGVGGANGAAGRGAGGAAGAGGSGVDAGSGTPLTAGYFIGADITFVQADEARRVTYTDSDGVKKDILQILKGHGFNYIRLRTFVDPRAADGYDKTNGYADLAHTITFGQRIKAAGMGFLLDFHYSDNWADPGKQCVPIAWQGLTTITALAAAVHDYTKDAIAQLVAAGARPDMVQIGNEITPGLLIHRCDSGGQPTGDNPITGRIANWTNLGMLLNAGVAGVKEIDPGIKIMIHIDRGGDKPADMPGAALQTSIYWVTNLTAQRVPVDVLGESCYQLYQGDPASATNTVAGWTNTFTSLATRYPTLKFVAAEYGPLQREINNVLFGLPGQQGIGTFVWEPTHSLAGNTGHALFTNAGVATSDLLLYDAMRAAYAGRL